MKQHLVVDVIPKSLGAKIGFQSGDVICQINHMEIRDVFDYKYLLSKNQSVVITYIRNGIENETSIKNEGQDLGIVFDSNLMDEYHRCKNNCLFCFIGQLSPQLKKRLSLKEDDCRKSFFPWNKYEAYCTLIETPMSELERYVKYGLSPVNVSIHSTDPETRVKIFRNPHASNTMEKLKYLYKANIEMNALIVVCPEINDGENLDKTLQDLFELAPVLKTVAVGPVGITKFQREQNMIRSMTISEAKHTLAIIKKYQTLAMDKYHIPFVQGSDLLYCIAGETVPNEAMYDHGLYHQLGNGVGMVRMFIESFISELELLKASDKHREVSIATGAAFYPILDNLLTLLHKKLPNIKVHLYKIRNNYFGGNVVVSGLITANDLMEQLDGKPLGSTLYLSNEMIGGSGKFIDGIAIDEVEDYLQVSLNFNTTFGKDLVASLLGNET